MDFNKFFQSKIFKLIFFSVAGLIVFLVIFKIGTFVGYKKASFSYQWGENYHRNFGGPKEGFFRDFDGRDYIEAYGVFGQIIKIDGSTLVIKGQKDTEKIVLMKDDTAIKRFQETVKSVDLKINDFIVVVGEPNEQGQIEAKLIRIMPEPPARATPGPFVPWLH